MPQYTRHVPTRAPAPAAPPPEQLANSHKRQMQQFYLHKLFDLLSDAEFLPMIPSDPVATTVQMQDSMNKSLAQKMGNMSPQYMSPAMQRQDMAQGFGPGAKSGRNGGHMIYQQFHPKRNEYAQYR